MFSKSSYKNLPNEDLIKMYLIISAPPTITENLVDQYETTQAQLVVLQCSAEGTPQPVIYWEHNDIPLDLFNPRFKIFPSGDLHISLAQSSDMGTYTCIAKNEAGSATKSMDLFVFGNFNIIFFVIISKYCVGKKKVSVL